MAKKGEVMTPAQLERLAEMRKKAQETKKMKAELRKTEKEEEKENLRKKYEEKVLKKKETPPPEQVEETDINVYEPINPEPQSESEDETPTPKPSRKSRSKPIDITPQPPTENYKQLYYKKKLERLEQDQQQQQFLQNYSQLPPQHHAIDIAQNTLRSKANKAVYESVYKSLFGL